jgi:hypothetical protein
MMKTENPKHQNVCTRYIEMKVKTLLKIVFQLSRPVEKYTNSYLLFFFRNKLSNVKKIVLILKNIKRAYINYSTV